MSTASGGRNGLPAFSSIRKNHHKRGPVGPGGAGDRRAGRLRGAVRAAVRAAVERLEPRQMFSGYTGTPYGGAAAALPGTVQAENYDVGGEGVAYHDTDAANRGGAYRTTEGVDVQATTDTGGGYNVCYAYGGEWAKYTVNVATTGTYALTFRVASNGAGGTFHLEDENGNNLTGSMTVPSTGNWQTYTNLTKEAVRLTAGTHVLKLAMDATGATGYVGNFNYLSVAAEPAPAAPANLAAVGNPGQVALSWSAPAGIVDSYNLYRSTTPGGEGATPYKAGLTATTFTDTGLADDGTTYYYTVAAVNGAGVGAASAEVGTTASYHGTPYGGTAVALPGKVEAENYDLGGEGVAYHDTDAANRGGAYRTSEGVDVQATTDTGGGYNLCYAYAGEWLKYTVAVATAGNYDLTFRVASNGAGGTFHLEDENGNNLTGPLTVPSTGAWQTYANVTQPVFLSAGAHVLKLAMDANSATGYVGNFNSFAVAGPPATPTRLAATVLSETEVALAWDAAANATSYTLYRGANGGPAQPLKVLPAGTTSYTDATAQAGWALAYSLVASDTAGASAATAPVNVVLPAAGSNGAYTVSLGAGFKGSTGATDTGAPPLSASAAVVTAASPEAAVFKAVSGTITTVLNANSATYPFGPGGAFVVRNDQTPDKQRYNPASEGKLTLNPSTGNFTGWIGLEDLYAFPSLTDSDFNDWYWPVTVQPVPPPAVAAPASAAPGPVTGTTTTLAVLGADAGGEAGLTYTWQATALPPGAPAPTFSPNGTNAAKNTVVTFARAGTYTLQATITNGAGRTAASGVTVTVAQAPANVTVSPGSAAVADGATQQFTAAAADQFGQPMATPPAFTWSIDAGGAGAVSGGGAYTAPPSGTSAATVRATAGAAGTPGAVSGAAAVNDVAPAAPTGLTAATVSDTAITLSWSNADPTTRVRVERLIAGGVWQLLNDMPAGTSTYPDGGLNPATQYQYRVTAVNAYGGQSAPAPVAAAYTAPAALSTARATADAYGSIYVTWPSDPNLQGIDIERSADGTHFSPLGRASGFSYWYVDLGLTPGVTYYYRARAEEHDLYSDYSPTLSATDTVAVPAVNDLTATAAPDGSINLAWPGPTRSGVSYLVGGPRGQLTTIDYQQ